MSDESLRACAFCGRTAPQSEPFGTAETYITYPAADGSPHRDKSGDESVGICAGCAFAESPAPTEALETKYDPIPPKHLDSCDLCGHIGPSSGGCCGTDPRRYRVQDLMTWPVSIHGFDGFVRVCRDCTPIVPWQLYRRGGVECVRESSGEVLTRSEAGAALGTPEPDRGNAPEPEQALLDAFAGGED